MKRYTVGVAPVRPAFSAGNIEEGRTGATPTLVRNIVLTICFILLLSIVCTNTALALNQYQDIYVTLSARPLGMGGAAAAVPQPASVFYNPACLAALRRFGIMQNHSARHFGYTNKGGWAERDQLDGDTEAIVVPLPLGTYAHGWIAGGEYGYDYRNHPADGSLGFPRDHYYGTEDYDALAAGMCLPVALGFSQRRSTHVFDADKAGFEPSWLRLGEGDMWGAYGRVFPGLEYGHSELKHNFDWRVLGEYYSADLPKWQQDLLRDPGWNKPTEEPQADPKRFSSRIKSKRTGFAFHPTGWITLASDDSSESYTFRDAAAAYGSVHTGNKTIHRTHLGGEVNLGNAAVWRWGLYDGRPTCGATLNICGLNVNYAECKDLLPEIIGTGDHWKDVHVYGFSL